MNHYGSMLNNQEDGACNLKLSLIGLAVILLFCLFLDMFLFDFVKDEYRLIISILGIVFLIFGVLTKK